MVTKIACFYTATKGSSASESPVTSHQTITYYIPEDSHLRFHLHGDVFTPCDIKMYYGNTAVEHEPICDSRPRGRLYCSHLCCSV